MAKITLRDDKKLFEIANGLIKVYRNSFDANTISRANQFTEGVANPSRNYMYSVIINTKGKAGILADVYSKATAQSLVKLTISGLNRPVAESQETDLF